MVIGTRAIPAPAAGLVHVDEGGRLHPAWEQQAFFPSLHRTLLTPSMRVPPPTASYLDAIGHPTQCTSQVRVPTGGGGPGVRAQRPVPTHTPPIHRLYIRGPSLGPGKRLPGFRGTLLTVTQLLGSTPLRNCQGRGVGTQHLGRGRASPGPAPQ